MELREPDVHGTSQEKARVTDEKTPGQAVASRVPWQKQSDLSLRALVDVLAVSFAFFFSHQVYSALIRIELLPRVVPSPYQYAGLGILFGVGVVLFGLSTGAYGPATSVLQYREIRGAVNAVWLTAASLFGALFLFKVGSEYSRLLLMTAVVCSVIAVIFARRASAPILSAFQRSGNHNRRVVIAGAGQTARLLMKKIIQAPTAGLSLVGFVDDYVPLHAPISCRIRQGTPDRFSANVLGRTWDLTEVHRTHDVHLLLLALSDMSREAVDAVVQGAEDLGIDLALVPRLGDLRADQLELQDLAAIPLLVRSPIRHSRVSDALKRLLDLLVGVPLFVLSLPVWLVASAAIRLDSPGPILFRQVRVGRDGGAFVMLKFRTMVCETDGFALSPESLADPRITRVGRWLRLSGLDELPQLLNVLRGDMSLVGPRPEMPFLVEGYSDLERTRLTAKPGITGLWQLSPDREAQIHENLEYDIYYARNQSLLLDILVLAETVIFTVSLMIRRFAESLRMFFNAGEDATGAATNEDAPPFSAAYLLLALDQRVRGGEGRHWRRCLEAAQATAGNSSIKVLVAPGNLAAMASALERNGITGPDLSRPFSGESPGDHSNSDASRDGARPTFELVPYRGSADLTDWVEAAQIVVTDLRHVRDRLVPDDSSAVVFLDDAGQVSAEGSATGSGSMVFESLVEALHSA